MQTQSTDGYKRLVVILINLTILACMWLSIVFVDPQSTLNPFKPPRLRTQLALAVSPTAALIYPIDTPAIVWTPLPTWTFTPTPTDTPTPTISPSPSPSPYPSSTAAPPTVIRPTPILGISIDSPIATKWIDVDIGDQTITAYMGGTALKKVAVSTGVATHPTVVGRYKIYDKLASQTMTGGSRFSGDYYSLPDVPWIMYFYAGYAIHGTYWHKNFGHPMSHGCVNLTIADAKWFYDWAEVGTLVVTHL